jgi:hypothetical protein
VRALATGSAVLLALTGLPVLLCIALLTVIAPVGANAAGTATDNVAGSGSPPVAASPYTGADSGCTQPDPTSRGCLTPTTRHALDQTLATFGQPGPTSTIRSAGCWDEHAWNPRSDHPKGRACDFFPTRAGHFPAGDELRNGWQIANWLRSNAEALDIAYIIWQGRIWTPTTRDQDGWGRRYNGGGVYDTGDATGGHYDHIHMSIQR